MKIFWIKGLIFLNFFILASTTIEKNCVENFKKGGLSTGKSESVKKGEATDESAKKIFSEGKLNKEINYKLKGFKKQNESDKKFKKRRKNRNKMKNKKNGFSKGFHDKYHLNEEKKGKKFWGSSESSGKYLKYEKKKKKKNSRNKEKNQIKKETNALRITKKIPGGHYYEVSW